MILTGNNYANLLNFDKSKEVSDFLDLLTTNWFTLQILRSTRSAEHNKSSQVDNIFVTFSNMHCTGGKLIEKLTNHLPNSLIIENLNTNL